MPLLYPSLPHSQGQGCVPAQPIRCTHSDSAMKIRWWRSRHWRFHSGTTGRCLRQPPSAFRTGRGLRAVVQHWGAGTTGCSIWALQESSPGQCRAWIGVLLLWGGPSTPRSPASHWFLWISLYTSTNCPFYWNYPELASTAYNSKCWRTQMIWVHSQI